MAQEPPMMVMDGVLVWMIGIVVIAIGHRVIGRVRNFGSEVRSI